MQTDNVLADDTIFDGAVHCLQYKNGYRFSIDAVLAAHFQPPSVDARVLDLGGGCGIISLIVMYRWGDRLERIQALELQTELQELADINISLNHFGEKCTSIQGDVREISRLITPESFTHIICNPPYYRRGQGRESNNTQARIARHQISAGIYDFTQAAALAVKNGGSAVFIYPAEKFSELSEALATSRLEIKKLQFVYSYPSPGCVAKLVLVQCIKNGGRELKVLEPFYVYAHMNGEYSHAMQQLYSPRQDP